MMIFQQQEKPEEIVLLFDAPNTDEICASLLQAMANDRQTTILA